MIQRDLRDLTIESKNGYAKLVTVIFKDASQVTTQTNSLELDPILDAFLDQDGKELYPIELMLISKMILFMFITAKHTSEQWQLKGQCALVSADLKKVQTSFPRACNDDHLITGIKVTFKGQGLCR